MEVPRLGVQLELQLPAYTTATITRDPSCVCDLHHSSRQSQILNPLSEARDQTCNLMVLSWIHFLWTTTGTPEHILDDIIWALDQAMPEVPSISKHNKLRRHNGNSQSYSKYFILNKLLTSIWVFSESSSFSWVVPHCWWLLTEEGGDCWRLGWLWQFLKTTKFTTLIDSSFEKWFLCSMQCYLIAIYLSTVEFISKLESVLSNPTLSFIN